MGKAWLDSSFYEKDLVISGACKTDKGQWCGPAGKRPTKVPAALGQL